MTDRDSLDLARALLEQAQELRENAAEQMKQADQLERNAQRLVELEERAAGAGVRKFRPRPSNGAP